MKFFDVAVIQLKKNLDLALLAFSITICFSFIYISSNLGNITELLSKDFYTIVLMSIFITIFSLTQALLLFWILNKIKRKLPLRILLILTLLLNFTAGNMSRYLGNYLGTSQNNYRVLVVSYVFELLISISLLVYFRNNFTSKNSQNISKAIIFGLLFISIQPVYNVIFNSPSTKPLHESTIDEEKLRAEGFFEWYDLEKSGLDIESAKRDLGKYDFYYFILDGYPSFNIQENTYGIEDGTREKLEEIGLLIAENSRNNYQETFLSIPSLLRMQYLHESLEETYGKSEDQSLPRSWMKQNETAQFYKNAGYKFASLSPWNEMDAGAYDDFDFQEISEVYLNIHNKSFKTTDLQMTFTENNILKLLNKFKVDSKGVSSIEVLKLSETIANDPDSTFAQIYSWLPHTPPYFDSSGNPVFDPFAIEPDYRKHWSGEGFKNNIRKTNEQIISTVEAIINNSKITKQKPVILIASDHGTANLFDKYNYELDPSVTLDQALNERYENFAAFYFPDSIKYDRLEKQDKISPVNYGREILNEYANQKLKILDNKAYYAEDYYIFNEISDVVWN